MSKKLDSFKIILLDQLSCANCYALQNELKPLCEEKGIQFQLVTDEALNLDLIKKYEIVSYPMALLFFKEKMIGKIKGYQPREILEIWLDTKMEERGL